MTNQSSVRDLENKCQSFFSDLVKIQNEIRKELISHADGKNLKGNELVGWLGEIYGKLLFNGKLVDDSEEHDFIFGEGFRVSVKTRKGWNIGWKRTSAIPKIEGSDCPTHLLFVHLNDDYSIDRMWFFEWNKLLSENRFTRHMVRGTQRSFIFSVDEVKDRSNVVFAKDQHGRLG